MKKKLVASLAAAMILGVAGTSFAAENPFVDVPANHWSYASVTKLAQAGIVDGYGDGTYKGDKVITRYEMAQMVAKAMGRSDKADIQQKAEINKLAAEFSEELNVIGVRVTKLEKNQPNLKFTGTAETRYTSTDYEKAATATAVGGAYRMRLEGSAKVDDQTTMGIRMTSGVTKSGAGLRYVSGTTTGFGSEQGDDNKNTFSFDRYFITRNIGAVKTTLGAQKMMLGTTQLLVDNGTYSFDGVRAEGKTGNVTLAANYGRQQKNAAVKAVVFDAAKPWIAPVVAVGETTVDLASLEASSKAGKLSYGVGYATLDDKGNGHSKIEIGKYTYGNVLYSFTNKLSLGGEYVQNKANYATSDNNAWNAIVTYGYAAPAASGQQNISVKYYDIGKNSITRFSTLDVLDKGATPGLTDMNKMKGINVTYNYAFSKNLTSYMAYVKATDKTPGVAAATDLGYNFYRFGVVSKF